MSKARKVTSLAEEIIEKIPDNKRSSSYEVRYGLFSDPRKGVHLVEPDEVKKRFKGSITKGACFSNVFRSQLKAKNLNRVYAEIRDCKKTIPKFTTKERRQWIKLAQKYNFLPEYIKEAWADKGKYVFNLNVKDMSPSLLYAYLSMVRYLRDEPAFAKSVLIMVNHGVNYYIAFVLASRMYIQNSGHHIVNTSRGYPYILIKKAKEFRDTILEIGTAISLKRYFDNPGKWDKRSVFDIQMWNCQTTIKAAAGPGTSTAKASNLFDPSIIKTVMGD